MPSPFSAVVDSSETGFGVCVERELEGSACELLVLGCEGGIQLALPLLGGADVGLSDG